MKPIDYSNMTDAQARELLRESEPPIKLGCGGYAKDVWLSDAPVSGLARMLAWIGVGLVAGALLAIVAWTHF